MAAPSRRKYTVTITAPGSPLNVLFTDTRRYKDSVAAGLRGLKEARKHFTKAVEVEGQSVNVEVELLAE